MSNRKISRSQFVRGGASLAAGALWCEQCALPAGAAAGPGQRPGLTLRPYQLLCVICALGEGGDPKDATLKEFVERVRKDPDLPLTLACNAGDVYIYQDPGTAADTPEGRDFNRKRDLDILHRMGWPPGITLPARAALKSLHKHITTVAGICAYDSVTSAAWRGCPKGKSGNYEKGHKQGLATIIPPRSETEMAGEKEKSLRALATAKEVTIRPHILLCSVCQYGGGTRPPFKPDNLPELLDLILHKNPDVSIKLARQADWMMCAPCPSRVPQLNACANVLGSGGLSNEKRDLDMLQILGLEFGSTMPARALFRLIFQKIPSTQAVCKRDHLSPSVWWDGCGESNAKAGNANYEKGRRELIEKLHLEV
jgi:hypothetical protein